MEFVTVVNRTEKVLHGTWDGRQHDIPPGESKWPEAEATAFKRQNPIMGSGDPRAGEAGMTGQMCFKIGIKEYGDAIEVLPELKEGVERWNRDLLLGSRPSQVIAGDNGIYAVPTRRNSDPGNLPADDPGFVRP